MSVKSALVEKAFQETIRIEPHKLLIPRGGSGSGGGRGKRINSGMNSYLRHTPPSPHRTASF